MFLAAGRSDRVRFLSLAGLVSPMPLLVSGTVTVATIEQTVKTSYSISYFSKNQMNTGKPDDEHKSDILNQWGSITKTEHVY